MIDKAREEVQNAAIQAALDSMIDGNIRCTLAITTGIGKTFIFLHLIRNLQSKKVLFLAETTMREEDVRTDIAKYKELYSYDIYANHDITFACYQSAYKWENTYYDFVACDEAHDMLSPEYIKYIRNNSYQHLLCLSATIDNRTVFELEGKEWTKRSLIETFAPIVFTYTLKQGQEDNTSRKLKIWVIRHQMDKIRKNVNIKTKSGEWMQSEQDYYNYCNTRFTQAIYSREKSEFLIRYWANKRASVLYNMPSKTRDVKLLLPYLDRTIVFSNSIDQLQEICPTVSSKNSLEENLQLLKDFNEGRINTIGSFKMLKQGKNLVGLNNVVLLSYYSKPKDAAQQWGRLRKANIPGNVFIFCAYGSQEEVWFNKVIAELDMEYITCHGIQDCIDKFTNNIQ